MKKIWPLMLLILLLVMVGCNATTPTEEPGEEPADGGEDVTEPEEEPADEPEPVTRGPLVLEDGKLYVAIIWHQHQPVYFQDPETGIYEKPWVRVHATKDYLDMAAMLEDYPTIHATFNITPSLIRQLDDIAAGAKDLYWVHAEIPADELTDEQKQFILAQFFDTNPTIIARFPRYQELADMRDDPEAWGEQDYRDLQVLFNLAWTDPDWLAEEPLASLVAKGRDFDEADKAIIFAEHLRIVQEVIPYHAALQQTGQIEVTMTPFAHPILPLILDSDLAAIAMPDAELPSQFAFGQDAMAQLSLGVEFYEDHFGMAPRGMWPAEGSVAQRVVTMIANEGIQWIATDEMVLENSLPDVDDFTRDSDEIVIQADELFRPYAVEGGRGGPVAIIFREHRLSDLVGFEYSGLPGDVAANDLITRLEAIQARLEEDGAEGPHLVTVLLDGENAWEYYENDGKEFLNEMYRRLSESETLVTVTPSEYLDALDEAGEPLPAIGELWAGSWIDGTFSTWIGEEEENLAWEYLLRTRRDVQDAINTSALDDETLEQVMELMYIAEGSDWFWWYGADQNSGADDAFDRQYRAYLGQIYELLGQPIPDFVSIPVIPEAAQEPDTASAGVVEVTVDGAATEGEWDPAGYYAVGGAGGLEGVYYGFSTDTLYLRADAPEGFADNVTLGFYLNLPGSWPTNAYSRFGAGETLFGFGAKRLVEVTFADGVPTAIIYGADGAGEWPEYVGTTNPVEAIALGDGLLEMGLPFTNLTSAINTGDRLNLRMIISEGEADIASVPDAGPALLTVPALPIANAYLEVEDPTGDDYGPGTYVYPSDSVFGAGVYDITSFTAGLDENNLSFRIGVNRSINNDWGAPNGMGVLTADIYIDVDGPGSGDRILLPGRNAALTSDHAWDYVIWAEGWTSGIYTPGLEGPVQIAEGTSGDFIIVTGQSEVTILVPRDLIPGDPETWSFAVIVASQEGYPSAGVWRLRDVLVSAEQWRIGGAPDDTNHTRLMDILLPAGSELDQTDYLGGYVSSQEPVDTLTADDLPQVPMVTP